MADRRIKVTIQGKQFDSLADVCRYYNLNIMTLRHRLEKGIDIETAVLMPHRFEVTDHTGKKYSSIKEMCKAWNIPEKAYMARKRLGWNTEKALTKQNRQEKIKNYHRDILMSDDGLEEKGYLSLEEVEDLVKVSHRVC